MTDRQTRQTIPASACPIDSDLTAKCAAELERRRVSELEATVIRGLLDSLDVKALCRAMASGDESRARLAFVLLMAEYSGRAA
jgi:hypothetical protein